MPFRSQTQQQEGTAVDVATRVSALEALIRDLRLELDRRFDNQDRLTILQVETVSRTAEVAQATANKAVVKAEAAAERAYLEAQIDGLRRTLEAQMAGQKSALDASIVSAKDALSSALNSSENAIQKAAQATDKRFDGFNEFHNQLRHLTTTFVTKVEVDYRFVGMEKSLEVANQRQHATDLKFVDYLPATQLNHREAEATAWRRSVDAQLVAAQSKSSLIYAAVGFVIAIGALLVGVFNLFMKMPLYH